MAEADLNIDNNYCNNALGSQISQVKWPWCYFETTASNVPEWGYCDIPTCERYCGTRTTKTSPEPAKQPSGHKDLFVVCWNKCFKAGPMDGPRCMDVCLKVSLKYFFSLFREMIAFLRIRTTAIKSNTTARKAPHIIRHYTGRHFYFVIPGKV